MMLEKYEVCCDLFHGFDWSNGRPERRSSASACSRRRRNTSSRIGTARPLSPGRARTFPSLRPGGPAREALRSAISGFLPGGAGGAWPSVRRVKAHHEENWTRRPANRLPRRRVRRRVDIFAAAGCQARYLDSVGRVSGRGARDAAAKPRRRAAAEAAKGEIATRRRKNVVQARSFAELLEQTIRRYQNRAIETAQVIEELIRLAKEMREANARGEDLGLSEDELAFYDALETNDSAVKVLGDDNACGGSPKSLSRRSARTSRSTGPCARMSARSCACWSSASCASTAIRPTSRKRRRRRCWSRQRCCRRGGQWPDPATAAAASIRK